MSAKAALRFVGGATGDRALAALLVAAVALAYIGSFAGAFVLDDKRSIVNNTRIRALWPPTQVLSGRRPVVDATLAINHAVAELNPVALHAVNLLIHLLAALTLMGLVRRTLTRYPLDDHLVRAESHWCVSDRSADHPQSGLVVEPRAPGSGSSSAERTPRLRLGLGLYDYTGRLNSHAPESRWAFAVALLWALHPLQTQSVTYLIQRAESLMGLFYLLTLYCVARGVDAIRPRAWHAAAVAACAPRVPSRRS